MKETLQKKSSSKSDGFKLHILHNRSSKPKLYKETCAGMCSHYFKVFRQKVWLLLTPLMETKVIVTLLLYSLGPLAYLTAVEVSNLIVQSNMVIKCNKKRLCNEVLPLPLC